MICRKPWKPRWPSERGRVGPDLATAAGRLPADDDHHRLLRPDPGLDGARRKRPAPLAGVIERPGPVPGCTWPAAHVLDRWRHAAHGFGRGLLAKCSPEPA